MARERLYFVGLIAYTEPVFLASTGDHLSPPLPPSASGHERMFRQFFPLVVALTLCAVCLPVRPACAAHGVSIDGTLKYPAEFSRFAYVDPAARQGGSLTLHDLGSFDKMNPFTLKGNGPAGLTRYVFETLAVPSLDEPFAEYGLIAEDIALAPDRKSSDLHPQPQGALFRRHADHRRGHQSLP